jgi:radical SAM superfamily enzyme YgiQ (UPF0313 family)
MDVVFLTGVMSETKKMFRIFGPYQLAWYLRKHNYECQVIDWVHVIPEEDLWKLMNKFITSNTKVLAWGQMGNMDGNANWWTEKLCDTILPRLRSKFPQLKIICGGASVHDVSKKYRNASKFDMFFYGHAENTILAYCNQLYRDGPKLPFEISFGNKVVRETFADSIVEKFDIHDCNFRWHKNDCVQFGESLPFEVSRGCIFKCKFCRFPNIGKTKNDFTKSLDNIINELVYNYETYGTTNYYFLEDTFNDDHKRLTLFKEAVIKLPFKINFAAYFRADLLAAHPDQPEILEESGLISGFLGIETFNPEASTLIGKPWSGKYGKQFVSNLRKNVWKDKIPFRSSMILGIPPETPEMLWRTNRWFIENNITNWHWNVLQVSRDVSGPWVSEFDRESEKYGIDWVVRNGVNIWKTKYLDEHSAWKLKASLDRDATKYQKLECWSLIEMGNYGYDLHSIKNTFIPDLLKEQVDLKEKRKTFLNNYINSLYEI